MNAPPDVQRASRSPLRLALRKFAQHRLAIYGMIALSGLYALMILAEFAAPYDFKTTRSQRFHPPSRIHWRTPQGRWTAPYAYAAFAVVDGDFRRHYVEASPDNLAYLKGRLGGAAPDTSRAYPLRLFVRGDEYRPWFLAAPKWLLEKARLRALAEHVPDRCTLHLFGLGGGAGPGAPMFHLLGADDLGRDLFSRILYGSRVSLTIGFAAVVITFSLGLLIGGVSGYFGGRVDISLQRLVEAMMLLPGFYILLALYAALPKDLSSTGRYFAIVLILACIGWAGLARTVRGIVLSLRQNDYVLASRALGVRPLSIIVRHILPNTFSYVIVAVTLAIPGYMLGESGLSFLGLGIAEPYASWGNMLGLTRDPYYCANYPWILVPGLFILLTVVSFNLLGDGLRDAFDPKTVVGRKT